MKKFKVGIYDDYTEEHVEAVKKLLHNLNGVEVLQEEEEYIEVSASEEIAGVLMDLWECDFLEFLEVK